MTTSRVSAGSITSSIRCRAAAPYGRVSSSHWASSACRRAARRQELLAQWELDTLPYGAAARHLVHDVIDPADTRDVVIRFLEQARTRTAIGRHRLAGWPTKF